MEILTEIQETAPQVWVVLQNFYSFKNVFSSSSSSSSASFTDESYMASMEILFVIRKLIVETDKGLHKTVVAAGNDNEKFSLSSYHPQKLALQKLFNFLQNLIQLRVNGMRERKELLPRILRFAEKVNLTPQETNVLVFLVLVHCSELGRPNFLYHFVLLRQDDRIWGFWPVTAAIICECSPKEAIEFLYTQRIYVTQGLIQLLPAHFNSSSPPSHSHFSCPVIVSPESIKVFMGSKLSNEEALKIAKTVLAEIYEQEEGNRLVIPKPRPPPPPVSLSLSLTNPPLPPAPLTGPPPPPPVDISKRAEVDLDVILQDEKKKELEKKLNPPPPPPAPLQTSPVADEVLPYKTDLEYLDDNFKVLAARIKLKNLKSTIHNMAPRSDLSISIQEDVIKLLTSKAEQRLAKTMESGEWLPRLERLAEGRNLDNNEKSILLLLIGYLIVPSAEFKPAPPASISFNPTVSDLISVLCSSLEQQIQFRLYFYKSSKLVKEGFIRVVNMSLHGDLIQSRIEIYRRMLDFTVGLDTEFSEIVEGSHLYHPKVQTEQVVLPDDQKQLILNTVSNFENYQKWRKKMGFEDTIAYGNGMVLLFYGASGTGKTMMANSVANMLKKQVLLINFPTIGTTNAGENLKFIFREAKINQAILFFDECESIFETRERGKFSVNTLLTELERHDGLIILATNRPFDLDEAMHRRITLAIEFKKPDHLLRQSIWQSLMPKSIVVSNDIDWKELAMKFELTGGFIKNAILTSLSLAVARDSENPIIQQSDLVYGARLQLRGKLQMTSFEYRVVPTMGIDECILNPEVIQYLHEIVNYEKARAVLFGQWGFGKHMHFNRGTAVLFHGPPGTGKSLAAEAIGYEIGRPLKVVNCAQLVSKYVGNTGKNIEAVFEEAAASDAVLLFDEAEGIFGQRSSTSTSSTDKYSNMDTIIIISHSCFLLLRASIDNAFFRRLRYVIEFPIPKPNLRVKLWQAHIPKEAPVADDINFEVLAHKFDFAGGNIKNAVVKAAARAALRSTNTIITMDDLSTAANEELKKMKNDFSGDMYL